MKKPALEVVRGSGNVFQDFGDVNAEILQMKAILASEIIKRLDKEGLTVREAHAKTGIAAADFSRIRQADLARFSLDRLMTVIIRLGASVNLAVKDKRGGAAALRNVRQGRVARKRIHAST
ncbi:MAG: helix-turn-helix transcriptional regulator [Gammaproteobacteria bacterium]